MQTGATIYSVMGMLREDYYGTLDKLAEAGIRNIEYVTTPTDASGSPVHKPREIGNYVKEIGLKPVSSHVNFENHPDSMKRVIEDNLEMGSPRLVLPFASMNTLEEIHRLAEMCNTMGELCQEYGTQFYYHNHFQEFVTVDGEQALKRFLEATDPELVQFQMDVYWVVRAGHDPIRLLRELGPRCTMIHQKDLATSADPVNLLEAVEPPIDTDVFRSLRPRGLVKNGDFVTVGQGVLDVPAILQAAHDIGAAQYVIVELDNLNDVKAVKESHEYLKKVIDGFV